MLFELGIEVWVGDATEISRLAKRRQKNDRRDAELILDLLAHDEFPRLYRLLRRKPGGLTTTAVPAPAGEVANHPPQLFARAFHRSWAIVASKALDRAGAHARAGVTALACARPPTRRSG